MEIKFVYSKNVFTRHLTLEEQRVVTLDDIDPTLKELETMVRRRERLIIFLGICFFLYMLLVFGGGAALGAVSDISGKQAILLVFFMVSMLMGGIYRSFNIISGLEIGIRDQGVSIVNKYNDQIRKKGFKWHVPTNFPRWVELIVDQSVIQKQRNRNNFLQNNNDEPVIVNNNQEAPLSEPLLNNAV